MKYKCRHCSDINDKCNIKCHCGKIISCSDIVRDLNLNGGKNMATIGEAADNAQTSQTLNIADLDRVSVDLQLVDDEFDFTDRVTNETKTVKQQVIVLEDIKYRVPKTVLQQIKILLEDNPNMKFFKVKKSGETKDNTKYQVIPLME